MRFIRDDDGVVRFEANPIVRLLLDKSSERGFGLNQLAMKDFRLLDWEEFYRLIGYSLTGYHELSRVTDESALAATEQAKREFPEASGCRDEGCALHSGVDYSRREINWAMGIAESPDDNAHKENRNG